MTTHAQFDEFEKRLMKMSKEQLSLCRKQLYFVSRFNSCLTAHGVATSKISAVPGL